MLSHTSAQLLSELPQIPGEPTGAYIAFVDWVQHGSPKPRHTEFVVWCNLTNRSKAQAEEWASGFEWQERVKASGYAKRGAMLQARATEALQAWVESNRPSKAAKRLLTNTLSKLLAADVSGSDAVVDLKDVVAAYKVLTDMERLEDGEATDRKELTFPDISQLKSNQLVDLRKQIATESQDE